MILPCEDNLLRNITLDRPSHRVGRYDLLPSDIEGCITTVMELELNLQRRQEILKSDLEARYDYSAYAVYKTIDRLNDGFIDTYNLSQFLKNNGHYATERETLAIIRRIDTDGDAKLSYTEFSEFLASASPLRSSTLEDSLKTRSFSHERTNRFLNASSYNSPSKTGSVYQSPTRAHSASHGFRRSYAHQSPTRQSSPLRESRLSPFKESAVDFRQSSPFRKTLPLVEEDELVRALKE